MRRIKKAEIKWISLVPRGANRLTTLLKEDGTFSLEPLSKFSDELGELYAVVYAPELRDAQGEIASAEVVKEMCHGFNRIRGELDIRHDGKVIPRERAAVVESYIVQKGDPRFSGVRDYDGKEIDPAGAWGVVIKIDDPELRKLYKSGKWQGVSMGGHYVETESEVGKESAVADRVLVALVKKLESQEDTVTPEELRKILADERTLTLVEVSKIVKKELAKAGPSTTGGGHADTGGDPDGAADHHDTNAEDEQETGSGASDAHEGAQKAKGKKKKPKDAPGSATGEDGLDGAQLDGGTNAPGNARKEMAKCDLTKIEDVRKLIDLRKREALAKSLDTEDVEALEQHLSNLEAAAKLDLDHETVEDRARRLAKENNELQIRVRKLSKGSNVPPSDTSVSAFGTSVSKEDDDAARVGEAMAKAINERRGYKVAGK